MSALTEQVADEHWAYRYRTYVVCKGCKARAKAQHLLAAEDWWRLHIAEVAEAATRAAVAAEIKARVRDDDLLGTYEAAVNHGLHDAARIAEGKQP